MRMQHYTSWAGSMRVSLSAVLAWMCVATLDGAAQAGITLHVDDDAPLGGDGLTWATPYRCLQDALAAAQPGSGVDEIRVGQGIYTPDQSESGIVTPGDRTVSFGLINGVALLGGYDGWGAPNPDDRDIEQFETVLSGDLAGDTPRRSFDSNGENSWHVVGGSNRDETAVIEGFTITGGFADGPTYPPAYDSMGAGIASRNGGPTIRLCTIEWNYAMQAYGGMGSSGTLNVSECVFDHNIADTNVAGSSGGALGIGIEGSGVISKCTFVDNAARMGGAVHTNLSVGSGENLRFVDCVFQDNAANRGGAMALGGTDATIVNCLFIGNHADTEGGAVRPAASSPIFVNCTFGGNTAGYGGAFSNSSLSHPTLANCILWGDAPEEISNDPDCGASATYSDVQGGTGQPWFGEGCIEADPMFGMLAYHPSAGSPCIDAGDCTAVPPDITTDLDGNPRLVDDPNTPDTGTGYPCVDMGAYEFQAGPACPADINGDQVVDVLDLLAVLAAWGATSGPADVNGDGIVDVLDLLEVLAAWGPCR